jgi:ankyrin repeat protein
MVCSDVEMAQKLLNLGVDVNARDEDENDAFLLACERENEEMASFLLSQGASGYTRDASSLLRVCDNGYMELAVQMLRRAAAVAGGEQWKSWLHARNPQRQTAMERAIEADHAGLVQALVDAGFDVRTRNRNGAPMLHYAYGVDVVRVLLDAGVEDEVYAYNTAALIAIQDDDIEILRLLLERFPNNDVEEYNDESLLLAATTANNLEAVRLIISMRAPGLVNLQDTWGCTTLFYAGKPDMVQLLLDLGADPRVVDEDGFSPLVSYSEAGRVRVLLDAAPDVLERKDLKGRTPLMHMSCRRYKGEQLIELFQYCEEHNLDACVNSTDINGDTALHLAMASGYVPTVKLLLEKGAKVLCADSRSMTTLMKTLIDPAILSSMYGSLDMDLADIEDTDRSKCLKALLDAVLLCGSGAAGVNGEAVGATETTDQPAAKRRKTKKKRSIIKMKKKYR